MLLPFLQKEASLQVMKFSEELGFYAESNGLSLCALMLPLGTEFNTDKKNSAVQMFDAFQKASVELRG